jgi:hypothetical protein
MASVGAGKLQLSPFQSAELEEQHRVAMIHSLRLECLLLDVADTLERAHIDMVVLKGPALANGIYPDPSWRPFGDIDVLVRTRDWDRVGSILKGSGFSEKFPEPRPGFRRRFGHTWLHIHESGLELDLHRILVAGPFGLWIDADEPFKRVGPFQLGGRTLCRLDDSALFVHACLHAVLGHRPPLLLPLRDVLQLASSSSLDWRTVSDLARRWRSTPVVREALIRASDAFGVALPEVDGSRPRRSEVRAMEAYTGARRSRGGKAIASLSAIRGVRSKVAYVWALLLPTDEFLAFREGMRRWPALLSRWRKVARWLVPH